MTMTGDVALGNTTASEKCARPSDDLNFKEVEETAISAQHISSNTDLQTTRVRQDNAYTSNDQIEPVKAIESLEFSQVAVSYHDELSTMKRELTPM